ncbi:MAG: DUF1330 domain-containing protein [Alphaproteobacteria bacterium]|nr:DUF1330 domain-containing protein [Alphaproteobacteria bacterium]
MVAYVIADIQVTDPVKYEGYKQLTPAAAAKYGGRFIARGGHIATLEGDWKPERVIILEFPSLDQAKAFYASVEYTAARRARAGAANMNIIVVEGV